MRTVLSRLLVIAAFVSPGVALADPVNPCADILLPGGQCAADVGAAVAQCCPCDGPGNHGQYVRCVAHATNTLRKAGCLDDAAKRSLKRCAARSTCGKPGFVTCCRTQPGECDEGFCAKTDPPQACSTNEECPPTTRCSIKHDADRCLDLGGVPGTQGSCCGACGAP